MTAATAFERSCLSKTLLARSMSAAKRALIFSMRAGSATFAANSILGLPTSAAQARMTSHCFLMASCATSSPAMMSASSTSSQPASTMPMASLVPATTRLTRLLSISS